MSHDLLDDLVADAPRYVLPDVDAAWRVGVGRRRRALAIRVGAGAAAVVVAAVGLAGLDSRQPVAPAESEQGVGSHPSFLPRPVLLSDLPARPGPAAAVLLTDVAGALVVDGDGRSWRLSGLEERGDFIPSLSRDGRRLGFMVSVDDQTAQFVMRDLVTGTRTEFPAVGDNIGDSTQSYMMFGQTPAYWSPDGRWLMTHASYSDDRRGNLLLGVDGDIRVVRDSGTPVGWVGDNGLGWLTDDGRLVVTDLDGTKVASVVLRGQRGHVSQWSGALSPDGSLLAVSASDFGQSTVTVYDVDTGKVLRRHDAHLGLFSPPVWIDGSRVAAWTSRGLVDVTSGAMVVEYSSHWPDVMGGQWASDALSGDESSGPGLLAWPYWQWLWWWTWMLVGLAGVPVLLALRWLLSSRSSSAEDAVDWWGGDAT